MIKQVNKAIAEIYGLSTDIKPTANVPLGSKFTEEDTGKKFELGPSGWFPLVVQTSVVGSLAKDVTFHDAATVAADGTVYTIAGEKTLTIEIYGTSTSRTIAFIGRGASGTDRAIMGVRLSDLSTAVNTTGTGELWQFDITGLVSVLMDLQAVAGGNVTVKGRAVS